MSATKSVSDIPEKPAERRAWILFQLRLKGLNLRRLAMEIGCKPQSLHAAASGTPSLRMEQILADRLSIPAKTLFPEHYARDGRRIPNVRGTPKAEKSASIHTAQRADRNVKSEAVA